MVRFALFLIFLTPTTLASQTQVDTWISAKLEMMDGSTKEGRVNFNLRDRKIQLRRPGGIEGLRERDIRRMSLTQGRQSIDFDLVSYKNDQGKVILKLAEIVHQSEDHYSFIKIYEAKESIQVFTYNGPETVPVTPDANNDSFMFNRSKISQTDIKRYLLNYDGDLEVLDRLNFLRLHKDKRKQLRKYIDKNQIYFTIDRLVVDLLEYYEALKAD